MTETIEEAIKKIPERFIEASLRENKTPPNKIPTIAVRNGYPYVEYCPNTAETCEYAEQGGHKTTYCTYASKTEAINCPNKM